MPEKSFLIRAGLIIGLLSFAFLTFDTAISYSDDARFCLSCHSMNQAYHTWQLSNHKQFKCTECHAPTSYVSKVAYKTKSGLRDLYATTADKIPQVIRTTAESDRVIRANCVRCHFSTVQNTDMGQGRLCTDCHRNLVH